MDLFSYKGRIGRLKYFLTILAITSLSFLVAKGFVWITPILGRFFGFSISKDILEMITTFLVVLVLTIYSFPFVKRLHDIGLTAWFYVLYLLEPIRSVLLNDIRIFKIEWVFMTLNLFMFFFVLFKRGTKGPNNYGQNPLEKGNKSHN